MEQNNSRTVFVVQVDNTKDLSDAKKYGQLKAVFGKPRKPYATGEMITRARKVLSEWKDGDYMLMIGDPTLCAVCMSILTEYESIVDVLSWDRDTFQYIPQHWDFGQLSFDFEDSEQADD